ncbi:translation elongation factor 4 [Apilactobacillus timberlakei]|uniref:translation elongation factor 4 n=1 Tax=Apilactobacillus timberlakei TaxID=2008380 RepID=UPI0011290A4B|nr:translation elongation factor 4 [Apilactobacillus timberlakei]TPR13185.1 elongation factor 4 [Apilactobacillus timberlakei]
MQQSKIRNFSIIAHIDHGKSTLSDKIMQMTDTVSFRHNENQILDDMDVEKSHGVTVRSRTVRNIYHAKNNQTYELNLIDTPGHVDFSYEVSKSLSASDGVILLVDATKGVQAQTVANYKIAKANHLPVIPVINKVDNKNSQIDMCEQQIYDLDSELIDKTIYHISAKTGLNVDQVLEAIVNEIPQPNGDVNAPLKGLIFDSTYDSYKGVIAYVRIYNGTLKANQKLKFMSNNHSFDDNEIGIFTPSLKPIQELSAGDIGYVVTGIKNPRGVRVGDTITSKLNPTEYAIPGYKPIHSVVYAGIYPKDSNYDDLKMAIEKLSLNDSSLYYTEDNSNSLGQGFRCGFLGMFHLQIVRERLINDFDMAVIVTNPNVNYHVMMNKDGSVKNIDNPAKMPDFSKIDMIEEPYDEVNIKVPASSMNKVMDLANQNRGELITMDNQTDLISLTYKLPVAEIAYNFFNKLKSASHGYATFDTAFLEYKESDIVKISIDINYAPVDTLTFIVHRNNANQLAQSIVHKLKYVMPKKLYPIPVQSYVEGRVIARVDVPPLRKNAAVSGEKKSVSKKQALLRRQNINKRKNLSANIVLPQKVFDAILGI